MLTATTLTRDIIVGELERVDGDVALVERCHESGHIFAVVQAKGVPKLMGSHLKEIYACTHATIVSDSIAKSRFAAITANVIRNKSVFV